MDYAPNPGPTLLHFHFGPLSAGSGLRAIDDLLRESQELWGTSAPSYLAVRKSHAPPEYGTLADAVASVETTGGTDDYLLIAFQDGGVISVSETRFAFQDDAKPATWWYPAK